MRTYFEVDPLRRRLRFALLLLVAGAIAWTWEPAAEKVYRAWHPTIETQKQVDAETYAAACSGLSGIAACLDSSPAPVAASSVNAQAAEALSDAAGRATRRAIPPTFALLVVATSLWVVIPLFERKA